MIASEQLQFLRVLSEELSKLDHEIQSKEQISKRHDISDTASMEQGRKYEQQRSQDIGRSLEDDIQEDCSDAAEIVSKIIPIVQSWLSNEKSFVDLDVTGCVEVIEMRH